MRLDYASPPRYPVGMSIEACMSSQRHDWLTPPWVLELVRAIAPIRLDPCTAPSNPTQAATFCSLGESAPNRDGVWLGPDGLAVDWARGSPGKGLVFVNPPYGRALPKWIDKCVAEAQHAEIVALVPSRTDTRWWQKAAVSASSACFLTGRLTFDSGNPGAPNRHTMWSTKRNAWVSVEPAAFPSCLFYWGDRPKRFQQAFSAQGIFTTVNG